MKNILILNAGTRNTLIRNFIKTIDGQCELIVTDSYELAPALYEVKTHYVTKRWDEEGYWEEIFQICKKHKVGMVLSLVDPELELLAERKALFEQAGIVVNSGDKLVVQRAFDKYQTLLFVKENGYHWIPTFIDFEAAKRALELEQMSFPLITKPRRGSGSAGLEIVESIERLQEICEQKEDVLIQEFVKGEEIGVDLYVDLLSKEVVSIFAKKKLKMRAGETDKSVSFKDEKLFEMIKSFARAFELRGTNDIDVFQKDGKYYISEVNPRFGGGYVHAYAAGVDFPQLLIKNMNGERNEGHIGNYKEDLYMMKYFSIMIAEGEDLK